MCRDGGLVSDTISDDAKKQTQCSNLSGLEAVVVVAIENNSDIINKNNNCSSGISSSGSSSSILYRCTCTRVSTPTQTPMHVYQSVG